MNQFIRNTTDCQVICPSTRELIRKEWQSLVCWNVGIPRIFKNRGSELLPMFLIASLSFSFLIAVHINSMRFHQVIAQHNFIFCLDVFALVHAGAGRQTPNTAPQRRQLFANKDPLSTGNLGKAKQRACLQPELLVPLEQHSSLSSKALQGEEKAHCQQRHD